MIDLTPIDERIQKRLFQKMELLGNKKEIPNMSSEERISVQQLQNKSTFIRMTSGLERPIILMGGELEDDGSMISGYDDIYGPRRLDVYEDGELIGAGDTANKFKRPLPGIKSIDVNFRGGVRALREATISWTCWSFEDINRLSPHFLSHGTTVMLEWGWVYNKNTLNNLPTLFDKNGVKRDVYTNYQDYIQSNNGDFDFTIGIVKNFEYTTRADGAFDCQTIITSVGASILNNNQPQTDNITTSSTYKISKKTDIPSIRQKIREARSEPEKLVEFDVNASLKVLLANIDNYLIDDMLTSLKGVENLKVAIRNDGTRTAFYSYHKAFSYLMLTKPQSSNLNFDKQKKNFWVRWGWFEDNILSKFLSVVPSGTDKTPITEFRSVEYDKESKKYIGVKIKNHKHLETVDINKYILPGQFKPFELKDKDFRDNLYVLTLSDIVNSNSFSSFKVNDNEGYLRNMLISTEAIKEAFGVSDNDSYTIERVSVLEGLQNLFDILNRDINFWSFDLTQDQEELYRTKIIDTQMVNFNFDKNKSINQVTDSDESTKSLFINNAVTNNGVFFFPIWRTDSIVKSQNVTTKIPDAMALSIMYGANYDQIKTLGNPPLEISETEGLALGGMYKNVIEKNTDKNLDEISIALKQDSYQKWGSSHSVESDLKPLSTKGSYDVKSWLRNNSELLDIKYQSKLEEINRQIMSAEDAEFNKELNKALPEATEPPPLPDALYESDPDKFNEYVDLIEEVENEEEKKSRNRKKSLYQSKFLDSGRMKQLFINRISFNVSEHGSSQTINDLKKTLLIPFDLELEVEGIGGILPGNSFHSSYLPLRYQEEAVFQMFDVGHKVDSTGWSVTIVGKMRSTLEKVLSKTDLKTLNEVIDDYKKIKEINDVKKLNEKLDDELRLTKERLYQKFKPDFFSRLFGSKPKFSDDAGMVTYLSRLSPKSRRTMDVFLTDSELSKLGFETGFQQYKLTSQKAFPSDEFLITWNREKKKSE